VCSGPAIVGSPNVNVNSRPALRIQDVGMHAACCGPNMWTASQGAPTVFINGRAAYRMNDPASHCGGVGRLVQGSADVIIGDLTGGGAAAGGSSVDGQGTGGSTQSSSGSGATASSTTGGATAGGGDGAAGEAGQGRTTTGADPSTSPARTDRRGAEPTAPVDEHWIEVQLVDDAGKPVGDEPYVLTLPDGRERRGHLSQQGVLRLDHLRDAGTCRVRFPLRDEEIADVVESSAARDPLHFVAFELLDADGAPVAFEPYVVHFPDFSRHEGRLDDQGTVRFDTRLTGRFRIMFPDRDPSELEASPEVEASTPPAAGSHHVDFGLVDEAGAPVAFEPYVLELPGGRVLRGALDADGRARVETGDEGVARVSFPERDPETIE
jgi:hypothetical protein